MEFDRSFAHLDKDDNNVVMMINPKYPPPTCPSFGKAQTTPMATTAIANLAQNAATQGLNTCPFPPPVNVCFGDRLDHFTANQPAIIWAGKSRRTATAISSLDRPFSRSFKEVTESFTWKPILQMR